MFPLRSICSVAGQGDAASSKGCYTIRGTLDVTRAAGHMSWNQLPMGATSMRLWCARPRSSLLSGTPLLSFVQPCACRLLSVSPCSCRQVPNVSDESANLVKVIYLQRDKPYHGVVKAIGAGAKNAIDANRAVRVGEAGVMVSASLLSRST